MRTVTNHHDGVLRDNHARRDQLYSLRSIIRAETNHVRLVQSRVQPLLVRHAVPNRLLLDKSHAERAITRAVMHIKP